MPRTPNEFDPTDGLSDRDKYMVVFSAHLEVILSRSKNRYLVDETVSRQTLRVCEQVDALMRRYPDPRWLARAVATGGRAIIGTLRAEDAQRGAGSMGGRSVLSLSADWSFDTPEERRPGRRRAPRLEWEQTDQRFAIDDIKLLQSVLAPLSKRQRKVLMLVDGYGYSVTEAAAILGIARETAARDRSRAYRSIDRRPPV